MTTIRDEVNLYTSQPCAYLKVLCGDENFPLRKIVPLHYTTTIGREKRYAEVVFHQNNDMSPVSALHCTLIDDEDRWLIQDEDSVNGTFLNGVRLKPLIENELFDGAIIELAPKKLGGVGLQFIILSEDNEQLQGSIPRNRSQSI